MTELEKMQEQNRKAHLSTAMTISVLNKQVKYLEGLVRSLEGRLEEIQKHLKSKYNGKA